MTSRFKYRVFTGPVGVGEIAARLVAAGIQATAGTEHVYGEMSAEDETDAEARLDAAARWSVISRRTGTTIERVPSKLETLAAMAVRGDDALTVLVFRSMVSGVSILATAGAAMSWQCSEQAWTDAQREARERLGIPEPAPAPAKAPKRKRVKA